MIFSDFLKVEVCFSCDWADYLLWYCFFESHLKTAPCLNHCESTALTKPGELTFACISRLLFLRVLDRRLREPKFAGILSAFLTS